MKIDQHTDPMDYQPNMEIITSDIMEQVLAARNAYDAAVYTEASVKQALTKDHLTPDDFAALLSPAAEAFLEQMAQRALQETRKHFGNTVNLFTPLYLANYCENYCVYCGFNCHNNIKRAQLNAVEIEREMQAIAAQGLEEILLLTGESPAISSVQYLAEACKLARKYFRVVGLEVYPMDSSDYAYLHQCGADFVTVFQETYNTEKYGQLHLGGRKRSFPYRFNAQERALQGGMRGVGLAALLGLDDFRRDAWSTGLHAYLLQRHYPQAEIAFSCPRLRPIINNDKINPKDVHERHLLPIICAYRIFLPFAAITISSRESSRFRDHVVGLAATKISAGVEVGIGGHSQQPQGDEQFLINDGRTVQQICAMLIERGLQPVMSDYVYV